MEAIWIHGRHHHQATATGQTLRLRRWVFDAKTRCNKSLSRLKLFWRWKMKRSRENRLSPCYRIKVNATAAINYVPITFPPELSVTTCSELCGELQSQDVHSSRCLLRRASWATIVIVDFLSFSISAYYSENDNWKFEQFLLAKHFPINFAITFHSLRTEMVLMGIFGNLAGEGDFFVVMSRVISLCNESERRRRFDVAR